MVARYLWGVLRSGYTRSWAEVEANQYADSHDLTFDEVRVG